MVSFKKIPYINFIPLIIIGLVLFKIINNIEAIEPFLSKIASVSSYFIWAFSIAYLLNPLMVFIERKIKTKRTISLILVYSITISFFTTMLILIIPSVVNNVIEIVQNIPNYLNTTENLINNNILSNPSLQKYDLGSYLSKNIDNIVGSATSLLTESINLFISKFINFTNTILKLITGLIISIYLLSDKEKIIEFLKKIIRSVLKPSRSEKLLDFGHKVNIIFKAFVIGKIIDSIIIGIITFIMLAILKTPYSLLIGVIIGITNLIPYFGNAIGLIPSCLIVLFQSPIKALQVAIVVIVISCFDGWYLSPKIIGKKIGLSPIWILVALTIGGGLMGFLGMFLSAPVAAAIKLLIENFIEKHESKKLISKMQQ